MMNFEQSFLSDLKNAINPAKKLIQSSEGQLNEIESTILQNKDKFTTDQLEAFDKAKKDVDRLRNDLKKF